MTPSLLLDTNLLVYGLDSRALGKQKRAAEFLCQVGWRPPAALPAQVFAGFANVMLYKMKLRLSPGEVYDRLQLRRQAFPIYPLTQGIRSPDPIPYPWPLGSSQEGHPKKAPF